MLVRPGAAHPEIGRILCACDDSLPAREALGVAAFLARTFVAELGVLTVVPIRLLLQQGSDLSPERVGADGLALSGAVECVPEPGRELHLGVAGIADLDMTLDLLGGLGGELAVEVLVQPLERFLTADRRHVLVSSRNPLSRA